MLSYWVIVMFLRGVLGNVLHDCVGDNARGIPCNGWYYVTLMLRLSGLSCSVLALVDRAVRVVSGVPLYLGGPGCLCVGSGGQCHRCLSLFAMPVPVF